jgi:hypothetical protein
MKHLSLFILLFSTGFIAKSQLSKPHFVSANFGTSIPLADYKKLDSLAGGSAAMGLSYNIEGGVYFSKVLGVAANIGAFTNQVDEKELESQLKDDFSNDGTVQVSSSKWVNGFAMVGPILSFGSKGFIVDLKLLGGIVNTEKPLINITTDSSGTVSASKSEESVSANFGFNYGLHFRIKLVGKLGLRINAEGFMTEQEFDNTVKNKQNGQETTSESTIKKEIEALNIGAGLVLTF